ncbi:MAG: hypothetical protein IJ938_03590 [Clostridia bacterium]|nr:hypothetical protein [Clostridia bacterium]
MKRKNVYTLKNKNKTRIVRHSMNLRGWKKGCQSWGKINIELSDGYCGQIVDE